MQCERVQVQAQLAHTDKSLEPVHLVKFSPSELEAGRVCVSVNLLHSEKVNWLFENVNNISQSFQQIQSRKKKKELVEV